MILTKYENIKKNIFLSFILLRNACIYIKKLYCLYFSFIRKTIEILYWKIVENL
jgi:hypothetical protein